MNVTLSLPAGRSVRRAYSVASSPLEARLEITVRRLPGGLVSPILTDEITVGQQLFLKGPYGRFLLEDQPMVWIAGGSGIVPFRSMWRYIEQKALASKFVLLYAVKDVDHLIYRTELSALSQRGKNIFYTFTAEAPTGWAGLRGRIRGNILTTFVSDFSQTLFYVCGPPSMCRTIVADLSELGVPRAGIRLEEYD